MGTTSNVLCTLSLVLLSVVISTPTRAADPNKVLRLGLSEIEGMDPAQSNDDASQLIQAAIFEGLYELDYLARPTKLAPDTASAPPEITNDGKTWRVRLKSGIFFTEDAAFGGMPRELVADDYVYSMKRRLDPRLRYGGFPLATDAIIGARAAVDAARGSGAKFDYSAPIEGLRALDRYTFQLKLIEPNYPIAEELLTTPAVAREVVEAAQGNIQERAVGTGPYRLKDWRHGTRVILEANPNYRPVSFPESGDPTHAELISSMRGKVMPQIGVIEISLIEEELPLLLEFERGNLDYVEFITDVATKLLVNGALRPDLAQGGVRYYAVPRSLTSFMYFNLDDPVLGGMSREHISLRRALVLGYDTDALARIVYGGLAIATRQMIPPGVVGHDPNLPAKSLYNPDGAQALLDRTGYGKRDAQGYRMTPDGKPLTLAMLTRPNRDTREAETLWQKNMGTIGIRTSFREVPFQDMTKDAEAGKFQVLQGLSWGNSPQGLFIFSQLWGGESPAVNKSRFKLPEYDRAFEEYMRAAPGPDQLKFAQKMSELAQAYAPMVPTVVRLKNVFSQPWLLGVFPSPFGSYWKYLDIDIERRKAKRP
jgi:oligopeptide transport system substrate-binding protein